MQYQSVTDISVAACCLEAFSLVATLNPVVPPLSTAIDNYSARLAEQQEKAGAKKEDETAKPESEQHPKSKQ